MKTDSDIYKMTAKVNAARKAHKIWEHDLKEQYVLQNLYVFSRGDFMVALTNSHNQQQVQVPNVPWADGTNVCNIFYPDSDCQTISGKKLSVTLMNGEAKVYIPKGSSYWDLDFDQEPQEIIQEASGEFEDYI